MDSRVDQQEKALSIKSKPLTLLLPDLKEKHYVINMMDTPGHTNFLG